MQRNPLAASSLLEVLCESEAEHVSQKYFYCVQWILAYALRGSLQ